MDRWIRSPRGKAELGPEHSACLYWLNQDPIRRYMEAEERCFCLAPDFLDLAHENGQVCRGTECGYCLSL